MDRVEHVILERSWKSEPKKSVWSESDAHRPCANDASHAHRERPSSASRFVSYLQHFAQAAAQPTTPARCIGQPPPDSHSLLFACLFFSLTHFPHVQGTRILSSRTRSRHDDRRSWPRPRRLWTESRREPWSRHVPEPINQDKWTRRAHGRDRRSTRQRARKQQRAGHAWTRRVFQRRWRKERVSAPNPD